MDYDLYIRVTYNKNKHNHFNSNITLSKDKPWLFTKEYIKTISDINKFNYYPNFGDLWTTKEFNESIIPFNCFLYLRSLKVFHRPILYKCRTNDKSSPLYKLTYGRDTFANILININYFLDYFKINLVNDIKILVDDEGFYYGLYFEFFGENGKRKKFISREDY